MSCCVSYLTLLMENKIKSKKIATDSNYLRCHVLLTAFHFPLGNTCSCKQDRKERYWGQQFWQMERDISVRPTEMTRLVTVDHLQSWSRIFRSDQTEMVKFGRTFTSIIIVPLVTQGLSSSFLSFLSFVG